MTKPYDRTTFWNLSSEDKAKIKNDLRASLEETYRDDVAMLTPRARDLVWFKAWNSQRDEYQIGKKYRIWLKRYLEVFKEGYNKGLFHGAMKATSQFNWNI